MNKHLKYIGYGLLGLALLPLLIILLLGTAISELYKKTK